MSLRVKPTYPQRHPASPCTCEWWSDESGAMVSWSLCAWHEDRAQWAAAEAAPADGLREALLSCVYALQDFGIPTEQSVEKAIAKGLAALAVSPSAAPLDEERLARALRAVDSLPVWREIPDKDNPSVVSVKPDYKATAAAIAAAYSEEGAG